MRECFLELPMKLSATKETRYIWYIYCTGK